MTTKVETRNCSLFLIAIFAIILARSAANFNLYLTTAEVRRILGLHAELYYIREGVVNDYAMKFSVKVAPEIHAIYFRWEALTRQPVLYNIAVWINSTSTTSGPSPLMEPSVNISLSGTIPVETETFQLNLPCTGLMNGQVEVILNLNVTSPWPEKPPTVLYFSRRKICLKGIAAEKLLPRKSVEETGAEEPKKEAVDSEHNDDEDADDNDNVNEDDDAFPMFAYVMYGLISLGFVIAIIAVVACWKGFRSRKNYPFPAIHSPVFVTASQNERKSAVSLQKAAPHSQPNIYSSPSGVLEASPSPSGGYTKTSSGLYAQQSALTGESYASVYKFPFPSTDSARSGIQLPCKCATDSSCSGIYESSCCSNSNSKSESYFSSRNSKEEEKCPLKCKFEKCCDAPREIGLGSRARMDFSDLREGLGQLQMDRERVRLTEILQEGQMGRVYKGWLQREHPELDQQVVIKTLREAAPVEKVEALCREGTLLSRLRHHNLMSLVGMSFASNSPPFLIYPDPQGKNLKLLLKELPLKVVELAEVCLQAAKGINFVHATHILHKDIATRNCIVSDKLQVRVTDGALAYDFFPEDYEGGRESGPDRGTGNPLPWRWMAPETLEHISPLSYSSDVWSLGVLLWEASTQAEQPYAGLPAVSLVSHLHGGKRLRQHPTCPDELYRLMTACWASDPRRRPSAQQATEFLASFRQTLDTFV